MKINRLDIKCIALRIKTIAYIGHKKKKMYGKILLPILRNHNEISRFN